MNELGFTDFVFIRLERCWQAGSNKGILSSLPPLWMQTYQHNKLYETDLILTYCKINNEPIFSSNLYEYLERAPYDLPFIRDNHRVIQCYKRWGYTEHYAIPMPAYNGNGHVMLLLTSANSNPEDIQANTNRVVSECRLLCKAIDTVSTQRFHTVFIQQCNRPRDITPQQLKVLRYMANEDDSIKELAEQLCISPITAHQHLVAIRRLFRVRTNIQAVVKAFKAGIITLH